MRALIWLFRAALFFVLFAFALNNQDIATLKWFFGQEWRAPMVFIVLGAFGLGCALGIVVMLPSWWRQRQTAQRRRAPGPEMATTMLDAGAAGADETPPLEHPPRDGL